MFERIAHEAGVETGAMSAEQAFQLYTRFAAMGFDTAGTPDGDGLLYQFGTYKFTGEEQFLLDFVRQFEVLEGDEHDHFVQLHCELTFDPTSELAKLGRFNDWYFYSRNDPSPSAWLSSIRRRHEWIVLRHFTPLRTGVFQQEV